MTPPSILIVAGEKSGENYGAAVVRAMRSRRPDTSFFGIGGSNMSAAGVEVLVPMESLSPESGASSAESWPRPKRGGRRPLS
jgi:lipid-A-disaccharide synthase